MKLATSLIGHVIEIEEDSISTLVIENPRLFRDFVSGLYLTIDEGESVFVFSEDGKIIKPAEVVSVIQVVIPFSINTKTLQTALLKEMGKYAIDSNYLERTTFVTSVVSKYIKELSLEIPYEICSSNLTAMSLFKAAGVTFDEDEMSLIDKVLAYIRLSRDLLKRRVFILIHARSYFSIKEINELISICIAEKILLLLLDSIAGEMLDFEERLIIDKDLCELTHKDDSLI
jgi:CRISPR type II-A-associated protein Csn2